MGGNEEKDPLELDYIEEEEEMSTDAPPSGRMKRLAEVVSILLHPVLIPSLIFGTIFYFSPAVSAPLTEDARLPMLGLLVFSTLFIPLSWLVLLRYFGGMPSLKMMDRKERPIPFLSISIFYGFITYLFITKYSIFTNISIILAGITLILFLVTLITLYWKISAHSAAICGAIGFLAAFILLFQDPQLLLPLVMMIVLAGASMSARLYLHVHKPLEVWGGAILGFSVSFFTVLLFWLMY